MNQAMSSVSSGFLANWALNVRASGRAPGKCACGFVVA